MIRLGFFASHNGSSARAIVEACTQGTIEAKPTLMISNNPQSPALKWAADADLATSYLNQKNQQDLDQAIADCLIDHQIDIAICSGYMRLIGPKTIAALPGKILNVHPALLPKYGGKGMYGRYIHQAVKDNGDTRTGITIHLVDEIYDNGEILGQKSIAVSSQDTVEDIEEKVKKAEPDFYIETLQNFLSRLINKT